MPNRPTRRYASWGEMRQSYGESMRQSQIADELARNQREIDRKKE